MGIKGLWDFLKKNFICVFETIPITSFRGKRIAIDTGTFLFPLRVKARSHVAMRTNIVYDDIDEDAVDKQWRIMALNKLLELLRYGITPILVFDGAPPAEKLETRQERIKQEDKILAKITALRSNLRVTGDPLRMKSSDIFELKKLEGSISGMTPNSRDTIRSFFRDIGIPCILCNDGIEAEKLASALVIEGIAAAVYSKDGDCLTHGAGMMIRDTTLPQDVYIEETDSFESTKTFEIVRLAKVLYKMGVSYNVFVEICITAGCDYNKNIPRFVIGNAYSNLKDVGRIENIKFNNKQRQSYDNLRVERCRELFSVKKSSSMFNIDLACEILGSSVETVTNEELYNVFYNELYLYESLDKYDLKGFYGELLKCYKELPAPSNYNNLTQCFDEKGNVLYLGDQELEGIKILYPEPEQEEMVFI